MSVFSRKGSKSTYASHIKVHEVEDSYPEDQLHAAFSGQDAVVLTINPTDIGKIKLLIDAAIKAGVKRFIPSEFGSDTSEPKVVEKTPIFAGKHELAEYLQSKEASGLSWTGIVNGSFFDWYVLILVKSAKLEALANTYKKGFQTRISRHRSTKQKSNNLGRRRYPHPPHPSLHGRRSRRGHASTALGNRQQIHLHCRLRRLAKRAARRRRESHGHQVGRDQGQRQGAVRRQHRQSHPGRLQRHRRPPAGVHLQRRGLFRLSHDPRPGQREAGLAQSRAFGCGHREAGQGLDRALLSGGSGSIRGLNGWMGYP